ncbi:glucan biosynthesis protein [Rubripirellula amarantea]|nr:glucan biosynthesis protein [Rubripirellula amarantea]
MLRYFVKIFSVTLAAFCISVPDLPADEPTANGLDSATQIQTLVQQAQVKDFDDLDSLVTKLAGMPYQPLPPLPESLAQLTYEDYLKISYRHPKATWWGGETPFWIETFHRGFVQRDRVELFALEDNVNRWIPFSANDFEYDLPGIDPTFAADAGHAGIKIAARFPEGEAQEVLTFLGSSYFRARSQFAVYGTSARGLAVDIALNRDEEFPQFRSFWVVKPKAKDKSLTIFALLDSPSVAGAYEFTVEPGAAATDMSVKARLHFRKSVEKLGLAPLTSMWMWGDGLEGPPKDLRPSVHDSDGLLIDSEDQGWVWRPFARQPYPSVSQMNFGKINGFGVMQRNTAFFHFDDHNAQYHRRPSVFVRPKVGWEQGTIELLELPGAHEGIDNIGAYWIPSQLPKAGDRLDLEYELSFFGGSHPDETEVGQATAFTLERGKDGIEMEIRFHGGSLADIDPDDDIEFEIRTIRGEVDKPSITKTETGDWLVGVKLKPSQQAPMELRLGITHLGERVTESFVYLCPHEEPTFVYPAVYTRQSE